MHLLTADPSPSPHWKPQRAGIKEGKWALIHGLRLGPPGGPCDFGSGPEGGGGLTELRVAGTVAGQSASACI